MDVILHIGAHRTATTSFQRYMRGTTPWLAQEAISFWGPGRTRAGFFHGMFDPRADQNRVNGRIALNVTKSRDRGRRAVIISDENMIGTIRGNLRRGRLYPGIGQRLARVNAGFGAQVTQVILTIRSLEYYWASALGYGVSRGHPLPVRDTLDRMVTAPRSWRDVITDVACAMPQARLRILPFETLGGRPDTVLSAITGVPAPTQGQGLWLNASPRLQDLRDVLDPGDLPTGDGRWQPFDSAQAAALRETYQDDLMWLAGGADGLAEPMAYAPKPPTRPIQKAAPKPSQTDMTRGRSDDSQQRGMAQARAE